MPLTLRADVHACVANGRVALLDLRADRYFGLPGPTDAAFQHLIDGDMLEPTAGDALQPLIRSGLLIEREASARTSRTPDLLPAAYSLAEFDGLRGALLPDIPALTARVCATARVRSRPLTEVVARVRRRKAKRGTHRVSIACPSIRMRIDGFLQTRRFLKTHDRCLPWSIAMVDHLAGVDCFPELVLGVKMKPFAAHAWVQSGDCVLSDPLDAVLPYTPILVV